MSKKKKNKKKLNLYPFKDYKKTQSMYGAYPKHLEGFGKTLYLLNKQYKKIATKPVVTGKNPVAGLDKTLYLLNEKYAKIANRYEVSEREQITDLIRKLDHFKRKYIKISNSDALTDTSFGDFFNDLKPLIADLAKHLKTHIKTKAKAGEFSVRDWGLYLFLSYLHYDILKKNRKVLFWILLIIFFLLCLFIYIFKKQWVWFLIRVFERCLNWILPGLGF